MQVSSAALPTSSCLAASRLPRPFSSSAYPDPRPSIRHLAWAAFPKCLAAVRAKGATCETKGSTSGQGSRQRGHGGWKSRQGERGQRVSRLWASDPDLEHFALWLGTNTAPRRDGGPLSLRPSLVVHNILHNHFHDKNERHLRN